MPRTALARYWPAIPAAGILAGAGGGGVLWLQTVGHASPTAVGLVGLAAGMVASTVTGMLLVDRAVRVRPSRLGSRPGRGR